MLVVMHSLNTVKSHDIKLEGEFILEAPFTKVYNYVVVTCACEGNSREWNAAGNSWDASDMRSLMWLTEKQDSPV
jgi:hypothetical protein